MNTALRGLSLRAQVLQSPDHSCRRVQRVLATAVRAETAQNGTAAAVMVRQQLQLRVAAKVIPHPQKAHYGGEDAHFVSTVGGGALGVADGVGGWNDSGISPAEYSRTFMETARKFLEGELGMDGIPSGSSSSGGSINSSSSESASSSVSSDWLSNARPAWDGVMSSDSDESDCDAQATTEPAAQAAANGSAPAANGVAVANGVAAANGVAVVQNGQGVQQAQQDPAVMANGKQVAQKAAAQEPREQQQQQPEAAFPPSPSPPLLHRTPLQALDVAHRLTRLPGSATACIMRLDGERGVLTAANLGDSGFLLLRGGQVVFQSPALQHFFDCPYQFGACPEYAEATDSAEDAEVYDFEVQQGDVIVLATDGLLDNCYTDEIVKLAPSSPTAVEQAAIALAELASEHANDPEFESPYTEEAAQEGFDIPIWEKVFNSSFKNGKLQLGKLRGGKIDDITVLVAYVEAVGSS